MYLFEHHHLDYPLITYTLPNFTGQIASYFYNQYLYSQNIHEKSIHIFVSYDVRFDTTSRVLKVTGLLEKLCQDPPFTGMEYIDYDPCQYNS